MEELICREGTVHSVIFQNAENGYTVLRLLTEEGEVVTVVGCIPCVAPGEHLTVTGTWEVHPQHGEQLKAQELERTLPEEEEDIFAYLSSGVCKGVGPTTARRIVDRFGLETLDILEAEPERLQEIRGITAKKAMEVGELFRQHMGLRRLMEFLSRYQLPPVLAIRLRQQYGDGAIRVVEKNPYLLSDDVCGVDFSVTDTMALSMGFAEDCTERLEAALTFELTYNENNGHVFLPKDKLLAATCQLLSCGVEQVEAALDALAEHHAVVIQRIANVEAVYLRRLWEAETSACARLLALLEMDADESRFADRTVAEIEKEQGITYAPLQRQAVELAAKVGVILLTGGPGTGKTTTVRGIVALFQKMGLNIVLAAPTGRAAKRMSELTGMEAQTVHRLLGMTWNEAAHQVTFQKTEKEPLEAEAVIVDEMSMVDVSLFSALLRALRPGTRLVLVGDADQLLRGSGKCVFRPDPQQEDRDCVSPGGVPAGGAVRHHPQRPPGQSGRKPGPEGKSGRFLLPLPPGRTAGGGDGAGAVQDPPAGQYAHPGGADPGADVHPEGALRHHQPEPALAGGAEPPDTRQAGDPVGGAGVPGRGPDHADPE